MAATAAFHFNPLFEMARLLASLWDALCFGLASGGVASLNRRLIAFMPAA
jgi:hypothetical protein